MTSDLSSPELMKEVEALRSENARLRRREKRRGLTVLHRGRTGRDNLAVMRAAHRRRRTGAQRKRWQELLDGPIEAVLDVLCSRPPKLPISDRTPRSLASSPTPSAKRRSPPSYRQPVGRTTTTTGDLGHSPTLSPGKGAAPRIMKATPV